MLADADDTVLTQEEIDAIINSVKPSVIYKVYFDNITGDILAITNELNSEYLSHIEMHETQINEFLTGEKNYASYKVVYTTPDEPKIVPKTNIYDDGRILSRIKVGNNTEYNVQLENYLDDKKWGILINDLDREAIKKHQINSVLEFYVSLSKNPGFLIRTFTVNSLELANNRRLFVDHLSKLETESNNITVYTKKFFEKYNLITI